MAAVLLYVCSAFVVWMCCFSTRSLADNLHCPSPCTCLSYSAACSEIGLVDIPKAIPSWITRVEFQVNGIHEILTGDLSGYDNVEYLDISQNSLHNVDGAVFQGMTSLRSLKLDQTELQEIPIFPEQFGITKLSLSENKIVSIPFQALERMPNLTRLDLSYNYIVSITNGTFPSGCMLTMLNLNSNSISELEKGSLFNLTHLETLRLNKNKLSKLPVHGFQTLVNLKSLELTRNQLTSIKGLTFEGMNQLQTLKLKRNKISHLETAAFFNLGELLHLHLDHNLVKEISKEWLYGLKSLKTLWMPNNKVSVIKSGAWECKQLTRLVLSDNQLTTIKRSTFAPLKHLRHLELDNNRISRIDEGAFEELGKLQTLLLNQNKLFTSMEDANGIFQSLGKLKHLGLRGNGISSIAVQAFSGLQQLETLVLDDNNITSIQENAFETLHNLLTLTFNSSKLSCDCHLAWLPLWLTHMSFHHTAKGTCHHPSLLKGMSLYQVDMDEECSNTGQYQKPLIHQSPGSTKGFKGRNLSLSCVAKVTGNSQPKISWKKDNELLSPSLSEVTASREGDVNSYTSTLKLVNLQHSSSGYYQCVAKNAFGLGVSQKAYISVYVFPVFTLSPVNVTVKVGKKAQLQCAATGYPQPRISWQKDGGGGDSFPAANERRMHTLPDDKYFFITQVQVADQGVYTCTAESEAGTIKSNATLTVMELPSIVQPMQRVLETRRGQPSLLHCMASGSPRPQLVWLKDGAPLVPDPHHFFTNGNEMLVILDTKWSDAGIYSCEISNSLGQVKQVTELKVLTKSGESISRSSSFSLDDKSTTTGIIIIAVVCCVVGTSLVWVIIIYQTRKRHEMYSAAPSDETTLPGEVPSSGYMSSDREGSYSQGALTMPSYHYQDYQMKESGYESSSGHFRIQPASYTSGMDEDEPTPVLTAGDRLLRQMAKETSAGSLQYTAAHSEDEETTGSQNTSSSDGDAPSSAQSASPISPLHPLQYHQHDLRPPEHHQHFHHNPATTTMSLQKSHGSNYHIQSLQHKRPPSPSQGSHRGQSSPNVHSGLPLSTPDKRPLLQTFHPKKHYSVSHEHFNTATLSGGSGARRAMLPQRKAVSREAVAVTERLGDEDDGVWGVNVCNGFRPRTHSDSCDKRASNQTHFIPVVRANFNSSEAQQSHCSACGGCKVGERRDGIINDRDNKNSNGKLGKSVQHEIQMFGRFGEYAAPCCSSHVGGNSSGACQSHHDYISHGVPASYSSSSSSSSNNCDGKPFTSSSASPLLPPPSSSSQQQFHLSHHPHSYQQHQTISSPAHKQGGAGGSRHSRDGGGGFSNSSNMNNFCGHFQRAAGDSGCDSTCEHDSDSASVSHKPPCCCQVMRDSRYCTAASYHTPQLPFLHTQRGLDSSGEDQGMCLQCCNHGNQISDQGSAGHKTRQQQSSNVDPKYRQRRRGSPEPGFIRDCGSCNCEGKTKTTHQHHCSSKRNKQYRQNPSHLRRPSSPPPYTPPMTPPPYIPPPDRPTTTASSSPQPSSSSPTPKASTIHSPAAPFQPAPPAQNNSYSNGGRKANIHSSSSGGASPARNQTVDI